MKKILVSLVVLAMCVPAMADVDVTGTDEGDGVLLITITPSGDAEVRGVALELETTSGDAAVVADTDVSVTNLNTNIDYLNTNGVTGIGGTPNGEGHPLAEPDVAGELDLTSARSNFSLSAGYLDASANQAGQAGVITFTVNYDMSEESVVSVALDAYRGGIVGDDLGTVTISTPTVTLEADTVCLGDMNDSGNITTLDLSDLTDLLVAERVWVDDPILGGYWSYDIPSTDPAYVPAGDINESGNITTLDLSDLVDMLVAGRVWIDDPILGGYWSYDISCP